MLTIHSLRAFLASFRRSSVVGEQSHFCLVCITRPTLRDPGFAFVALALGLCALVLPGRVDAAWTGNGVRVSPSASSQTQLSVASDGVGGIYLGWEDDRLGGGALSSTTSTLMATTRPGGSRAVACSSPRPTIRHCWPMGKAACM